MTKIDFSDILNTQIGSAPVPQPLPSGTYNGVISGVPTFRDVKTKEGEKVVATVTVAITDADEDVDPDDLEAAGGLRRADGGAKTIRAEFWLDDNSRYQFERFLAAMGLQGSYNEALPQLPGKEVTAIVERREYTTNSGEVRVVNDVKRLYAAT